MSWFTDALIGGLKVFHDFTGSWGLAIILLTLLVRALLLPLSAAQVRSTRKMQQLQPELEKLKQKYKKDPTKLNQETMELWKQHGVNPMSGCLVMLVQMPVLFGMLGALQPGKTPVTGGFLWIPDLSQADPYFILPVLAAVTTLLMFTTNMMNAKDPTQRTMMYIMPLLVGWLSWKYAAGLSIYWVVSNIFSIVQQIVSPKPGPVGEAANS